MYGLGGNANARYRFEGMDESIEIIQVVDAPIDRYA